MCLTCAEAVRDKAARSFAEVTEALMRTRQEYYDAMAGHRGDPDDTEAKANARLDAASLAYAKALRDYKAFLRQDRSRAARGGG
jgi:hypothetical protein